MLRADPKKAPRVKPVSSVLFAAALGFGLAGCDPTAPPVDGPSMTPALTQDLRYTAPGDAVAGCWHEMTQPAVFETVTEQVLVSAAVVDATGKLLRPAVFRTETHQRQVRQRQQAWFRIPCESDLNEDPMVFTASLQRALKARGFYGADISGQSNAATRAAILRFQRRFGLESDVLSMAAAQALGLVSSVDRAGQ